jgi:hypothetical protein
VQTIKSISKSRTFGTLCLVALGGLSLMIACGKSEAAPSPTKEAPATVAASSSFDKDQYTVKITAPATCKSGSECKAEISVKTKGEYHINDKYPIKFKAPDTAPDGVSFMKAILKKEDGSFKEKEGSMSVGFTASKAGKVSIGGTLSIGFCADDKCLMEKLDLAVDVDVK